MTRCSGISTQIGKGDKFKTMGTMQEVFSSIDYALAYQKMFAQYVLELHRKNKNLSYY